MSDFIAHVRQIDNGQWAVHELEDHLTGVAQLAAGFATPFSCSEFHPLTPAGVD